jgi:hypothetical protein
LAHAPGVLLGGAPAGASHFRPPYLGGRGLSICNIVSHTTLSVKRIQLMYAKYSLNGLVTSPLVHVQSGTLYRYLARCLCIVACSALGRMLRKSLSRLITTPPVSVYSCTL